MAILTSKTAFAGTLADGDLLHLVDVSDTTDDATGSSFKLLLSQLKLYCNGLVANTIFVSKSGNDSTGLVERMDKPFLTISAAITACNVAFASRTVSSRVKIIVERKIILTQILHFHSLLHPPK